MKNLIHFILTFMVLISLGCETKPDQTLEYRIENINLELEGPVFEGSNEAQVKVNFQPETVLDPAGLERKNIQNIRVKNISLFMEEPQEFDLFESALVQLVGGEAPLTSVALASAIPAGTNKLEPQVTDKNSFKEFKNVDSFFFVIDSNIKRQYEENIKMRGNIAFYIDVKK
ncbi:MAG: hypothetical protein ACK40G_11245 [Cytophagaceae bacterium]